MWAAYKIKASRAVQNRNYPHSAWPLTRKWYIASLFRPWKEIHKYKQPQDSMACEETQAEMSAVKYSEICPTAYPGLHAGDEPSQNRPATRACDQRLAEAVGGLPAEPKTRTKPPTRTKTHRSLLSRYLYQSACTPAARKPGRKQA